MDKIDGIIATGIVVISIAISIICYLDSKSNKEAYDTVSEDYNELWTNYGEMLDLHEEQIVNYKLKCELLKEKNKVLEDIIAIYKKEDKEWIARTVYTIKKLTNIVVIVLCGVNKWKQRIVAMIVKIVEHNVFYAT